MQRFGQRSDFAEDQQGRRAHRFGAGAFGKIRQSAKHDALFRARAVLDQRERRRCGTAMREQTITQRIKASHAHIHRQRLFFLRKCAPVERVERIFAMRSHQSQRLRVFAMSQRNAGVGGAGQRGGDAGYDFESDVVRAQEFQFFAATTEHKRIAALEPDDALAAAGVFEHQRVDAFLRGVVSAGFFRNFDEFGIAPGHVQHISADQAVVQNHVGLVEQAQRAQGQQPRIAGAGADEGNASQTIRRSCRFDGGIERIHSVSQLALAQQLGNRASEELVKECAPIA